MLQFVIDRILLYLTTVDSYSIAALFLFLELNFNYLIYIKLRVNVH